MRLTAKTDEPLWARVMVWLAALAVLLPLSLLVAWSFANRWPVPHLAPQAYTLRGWNRLFFGHYDVWRVTAHSVALSLVVGALSTVIATMTARALRLYRLPGGRLIEGLSMLPVIVPVTVFGMGGHMLFIRLGLNNTVTAVAICHLIIALPFAVRVMLEATNSSSFRFEEQARVLGASPFSAFLHGGLPIIAPGMASALAVSFLFSYTQYFLTSLMGGGKVKTLSVVVMPLIERSDRTISSAYSLLFIVSVMVVFLALRRAASIVDGADGQKSEMRS
jgi:putative spermidine/putrescine transport system permease protein